MPSTAPRTHKGSGAASRCGVQRKGLLTPCPTKGQRGQERRARNPAPARRSRPHSSQGVWSRFPTRGSADGAPDPNGPHSGPRLARKPTSDHRQRCHPEERERRRILAWGGPLNGIPPRRTSAQWGSRPGCLRPPELAYAPAAALPFALLWRRRPACGSAAGRRMPSTAPRTHEGSGAASWCGVQRKGLLTPCPTKGRRGQEHRARNPAPARRS